MKKLITKKLLGTKDPVKVFQCLLKLKDYEDTNLTPSEIQKLMKDLIDAKDLISKYELIFANLTINSEEKKIEEPKQIEEVDLKKERDDFYDEMFKQLNPKNFRNNFNTRP